MPTSRRTAKARATIQSSLLLSFMRGDSTLLVGAAQLPCNQQGLLFQQVVPLEIIGDRRKEGTLILFGGNLPVSSADFRVCHRRFGVGGGFPKALAVGLLRFAPLYFGHVGEFHDMDIALAGTAQNDVTCPAVDLFYQGIENDFCHISTLSTQAWMGMLRGGTG